MNILEIDGEDHKLLEAATAVLRKNYHPIRHSVGAAVVCSSGRIYTGINIEACGYSPCAEPIALGAALSNSERHILAIVAVSKREEDYFVLSPCGNCRQLLIDYAPDAMVIFSDNGKALKTEARNLLLGAYKSCFDVE